mgnify:CR=1 FL=1
MIIDYIKYGVISLLVVVAICLVGWGLYKINAGRAP